MDYKFIRRTVRNTDYSLKTMGRFLSVKKIYFNKNIFMCSPHLIIKSLNGLGYGILRILGTLETKCTPFWTTDHTKFI